MTVTRSTSPSAIDLRRGAVALAAFACAIGSARVAVAGGPDARACIDAATEGQRLRDRGRLIAARASFLACMKESCPTDVRSDCESWLDRVVEATPRVVLGARNASGADLVHVRVLANDVEIATELLGREQPLDPGPYRFVFEAEGVRVHVSAVLRSGDVARPIFAVFPPPPTMSPPPTRAAAARSSRGLPTGWILGLGGGTLLTTSAFAFFALDARAEYSALERSCAPSCGDDQLTRLTTDIVVANVAGAAALAFGAALGAVLLLGRGAPVEPAPQRDLPRIVWK